MIDTASRTAANKNATTTAASVVGPGHDEKTAKVQVRISGLNKIFGSKRGKGVHVLKDIDLDILEGELLVLLGPSGCGKTTLLRCLVGLEEPTYGQVALGKETVVDAERGVFVAPNKRDVSMVFQNYALWPHMKVRRNVAYPLRARKMKEELDAGRADEVLRIVQCDHLADRYPPELSGGQQQRVSLARAMATRPSLMLLDEPLSNLDALLRIELRAQLRHLHRTLGFTGVFVTHDQEEALALASRVAVMKAGEIEQIGPPDEVYRRPVSEYVADFLGYRNSFTLSAAGPSATVAGRDVTGLASPDLEPGSYTLRIRPSHLKLRAAGGGPSPDVAWLPGGTVLEVLPGVNADEFVVDMDETRIYVDMPKDTEFQPGDMVEVGIEATRSHCFGADGKRVDGWSTVTGPDPTIPLT